MEAGSGHFSRQCVGLVLLAPLLAATALLVKLTSPGPLFFRQVRDGLGGKQFLMYKFRTMQTDAPARKADLLAYSQQDGPAFKLEEQPADHVDRPLPAFDLH